MAEHVSQLGHQVQFDNQMALGKLRHCTGEDIHEAIKIREGRDQISPARKNIIHTLTEQRGHCSLSQTMNPSL